MKKLLLLIVLFLLISFLGVVFYNQQQLMHPKRRALQPYHYEWLNHPKQHSMKIIKSEGSPEILIVKYDPTVVLSQRSKKIKEELTVLGYDELVLRDNGILIMFHGRHGRKEDLLPVAERYIIAGYTCVLVDIPAHGENFGASSLSEGYFLYDKILNSIQNEVNLKGKSIYLWGISLGGKYAIDSAQPTKRMFAKPKALVLLSTFDNLSYVVKEKSLNVFGTYLGKALYGGLRLSLQVFYDFELEKVDSATNATRVKIPLFMLHGKKDKLIGYKHGENLFNHFPTKEKEFHLDEKGNHHNILITDYPFYLKSIEFLLREN
jgi:alpha-beta hydrolase superfamily lysophospholipase